MAVFGGFSKSTYKFKSIHIRHIEIGNNEIEFFQRHSLKSFYPVSRGNDPESFDVKRCCDELSNRRRIINNQNYLFHNFFTPFYIQLLRECSQV